MAVHGRVPIKASIECRVHCARAAHVLRVVIDVIELVGKFFLHALQCEGSEVGSLGLSERYLVTWQRRTLTSRERQSCDDADKLNYLVHMQLGFFNAGLPLVLQYGFQFRQG